MSNIFGGFDPQALAQQLATYDVMAMQSQLKSKQAALASQKDALKTLRTALTEFRSGMNGLNKVNEGMLQNKVTLSKEDILTASANSTAAKGTYNIFVESLASAHQVAFEEWDDDSIKNATGTISIQLGEESLEIDVTDFNSLDDLAKAINGNKDNPGVTASLLRSNGQVTLMLSSDKSGAKNEITVDAQSSGLDTSKQKVISEASDAKIWLGEKGKGLLQTSSTNEFKNLIKGVSFELNQAHKDGDAPLVLKVGTDSEATKEQTQQFIDTYNTLKSTLATLTASGADGKRGALAGDAGVTALGRQLNAILRSQLSIEGEDGTGKTISLMDLGITADKEGKLKIDHKKLDKILESDPQLLTRVFNEADGLIKEIDKSMDKYLSSTNGILKSRQETLDRKESQFTERAGQIEIRYNKAYDRYLRQFTDLQSAMAQMENTMGMFNFF